MTTEIIKTIEELKAYISTVHASEFDRYQPWVLKAERWVRKEITGNDLWGICVATPNDDLKTLVAEVVAHKAYHMAIPHLDVLETESGFVVRRDSALAPASQERVKALSAGVEESLTESVEDLLEYLETSADNIQAAWKVSKTYLLISNSYFVTLRKLREYAYYPKSRMHFLQQRGELATCRILYIEPVISKEFSAELIDQVRDDDVIEANREILELVRFSLANFFTGNFNLAASFLGKAKAMLYANPANFPAFSNSQIYTDYLTSLAAIPSDSPFEAFGI